MRLLWLVGGLTCVAVGGIGAVVPLLPTTVFFVMAAWCFARSSERLEQWVLNLPGIGSLVVDYREGLGMPRRAKITAISCIVIAVSLNAAFLIDPPTIKLAALALGAVGVWYVGWRVPTRETVLARSAADLGEEPSPS